MTVTGPCTNPSRRRHVPVIEDVANGQHNHNYTHQRSENQLIYPESSHHCTRSSPQWDGEFREGSQNSILTETVRYNPKAVASQPHPARRHRKAVVRAENRQPTHSR
ncbi:hypothetical protein AVEN_86272-1 [Araneus ventricosus]|uniref:Uncharacterized protein n=1 Tax=Araneus ventricosus TaxID=182803 RepID=A0A4Y2SMV0_ARAVE|nr:hypothetical protein AVEN_86272-1 [Araneus ventricosus]